MASVDSVVNSSFGGQYPVRKLKVSLTVAAAATSATATTTSRVRGTIEKIVLDPGGAMATSATLKGYEKDTPLATGTRDHFLDYTFPASEVELVFYPMKPVTTNAAAATTYDGTRLIYTKYVVDDYLTIDLGSAAAADSVVVYIYVRG
jgi:hypothetical protein